MTDEYDETEEEGDVVQPDDADADSVIQRLFSLPTATLLPTAPRKKGPVPPQLKPFTKGDPRINRKGRPKQADQLRSLILDIGAQMVPVEISVGKGKKKVVKHMTRFQKMILDQFNSGDPKKQKLLLEYAFGKPVDRMLLEARHSIEINVVREEKRRRVIDEDDSGDS